MIQTWREGWVERTEREVALMARIGIKRLEIMLARRAAFYDFCERRDADNGA